jgi:hypothetical protein
VEEAGEEGKEYVVFFVIDRSGAWDPGDSRFVLGIVERRTRRGARVASLTKKGFEVGCWERLPLEGLRECVGSSADESELLEGQFRTAVYTMVLTTGVWVAAQEGWLN